MIAMKKPNRRHLKSSALSFAGWVLAASSALASQGGELPPVPEPPTFDTADPVAYGAQIASFADRYDQGWFDEISLGRMTLFDGGGDSVERSFTRMVLEDAELGDKIIVRFMSPAEIKGVAALTHEHAGETDDNWLYLPSNKRVRRISGANKTASFQGTEFTYEDLSNLEVREYDWRFIDEATLERDGANVPVLRVEGVPNYADTGYSRILVYYNKDNWRRERMEYFDKSGQHLKTQDLSAWKHLHDRFWRADRFVMANHLTGKRTELEQEKVYLNLSLYPSSKDGEPRANLDDSRFTTQALQL